MSAPTRSRSSGSVRMRAASGGAPRKSPPPGSAASAALTCRQARGVLAGYTPFGRRGATRAFNRLWRPPMTDRVREILSWYASDNPGTLANLYRMLNHGRLAGTGKLVMLPVDQGFEHGPARSFAPNPAGYDPRYHFQLAIDAGCNAYAAPLGFIEAGAREYAGQIPLILKANNSDSMYGGSDPIPAVTASVEAVSYTHLRAHETRHDLVCRLLLE